MEQVVYETKFDNLKFFKRGKVRDIYDLDDKLLIVATDRISCFDVVLPTAIPYKGKVLTRLSCFWFEFTKEIIGNHFISGELRDLPSYLQPYSEILEGRFMLVKKAHPLPLECVVRGYLAGSAFKEYSSRGMVCGIKLPRGIKQGEKLDEPIFTPSTKAITGHDTNLTEEEAKKVVGEEIFYQIRERSIALYKKAVSYVHQRGLIIADTKFEFGLYNKELILIDEVLTPDSSRFWAKEDYQPGRNQVSFDKQFVRDYLESTGWDKTPPAPQLPPEIIEKTKEKYLGALFLLTGEKLL